MLRKKIRRWIDGVYGQNESDQILSRDASSLTQRLPFSPQDSPRQPSVGSSRQDSPITPVLSLARLPTKSSGWSSSTTLPGVEACLDDPETGSLWSNWSRASFLYPLDHHSRPSIGTAQEIDGIDRTGTSEGLAKLQGSLYVGEHIGRETTNVVSDLATWDQLVIENKRRLDGMEPSGAGLGLNPIDPVNASHRAFRLCKTLMGHLWELLRK